MPYTIAILTKNESKALPAALESIAGANQIVVVDSGSTDKTIEIAKEAGALILEHPFESFGKQREWTTQHEAIANDWILFLDADERATTELLAEIEQVVEKDSGEFAGFDIAWKLRLYGTWLKRCEGYPRYQTRLVHRRRVSWGDWGHGQKVASATAAIGKLDNPYDHEAYIHGWQTWWEKHQKYARQEAESFIADQKEGADSSVGLKKRLRALPLWPEAFWVARYILSGSFIFEGKAGFDYCKWRYRYERLCANLTKELRKQNTGPKA